MVNAVTAFGERNSMDFSESARFLVTAALNHYGYFRADYESIRDEWKEPPQENKSKMA